MQGQYSWNAVKGPPNVRRNRADHFGWWVLLAVVLAVLMHALVLMVMGRIPFVMHITDSLEWKTQSFNVQQVEVIPESCITNGIRPITSSARACINTASTTASSTHQPK